MRNKPEIGEIIQDTNGKYWKVTDNIHSEKFLLQSGNLWDKIKGYLFPEDRWIPVKKKQRGRK